MQRRRRIAWILLLGAEMGVLLWGLLAAVQPTLLLVGYERFTNRSWTVLVDASPLTLEFLLLLFRLLGAYNVAFAVLAIAITITAFRQGASWAWWALLIGDTIAFVAPMTYDRIVDAIGPFEVLEYVGIAPIFAALITTPPFRATRRWALTAWLAQGVRQVGSTRFGVWSIKHVVAPLDRVLYRLTGGRVVSTGRPLGPVLLLTTAGRRSGKPRTTPVFYLRDDERLVICNARPSVERANPWTLNLRAHPVAQVQLGRDVAAYRARVATPDEVERYWPIADLARC